VDDVLEIHAAQLAEHGGSEGLRDRGLLESAIAQPTASFGGECLDVATSGIYSRKKISPSPRGQVA
jgi:prophage maintenance system killer protein